MLRAFVYRASVPKHQLLLDIFASASVLAFYNNVWIHDNPLLRQVEGECIKQDQNGKAHDLKWF